MTAQKPKAGTDPALKSIFVISPIGALDGEGFDFTSLVLSEIVRPAAAEAGGFCDPVRADEMHAPGSITAQVVKQILDADVCVADLTGRNPNVMYEVAIAHAADKPVILLQQEDGGPPFDFADERAIHYSTRADKANRARTELVHHLQSAVSEDKDERLEKTLHPVRQLFKDIRTRAEASIPEQALFERMDALSDQLVQLRREIDYRDGRSYRPDRVMAPRYGRVLEDLHHEAHKADDPTLAGRLHRLEEQMRELPPKARADFEANITPMLMQVGRGDTLRVDLEHSIRRAEMMLRRYARDVGDPPKRADRIEP